MDQPVIAPLAPDCARLREDLIAMAMPPIWELDAAEARMLYRERVLGSRDAWRPPLDRLPVLVDDLPQDLSLPAMRRYRAFDGDTDGVDDGDTCLLWFHGGGWVLGDLDTSDAVCRTACAATGWVVVSVDYRCAPISRFPAAVDDALAAADWALAAFARVIVGGDSAGGTLAAVVAQHRGSHAGLVGQVLIYPAVDPSLSTASAHEFVDGPFLTRRDMEWFYGQYLASATDATDPRADLVAGYAGRPAAAVPAVVFTVGHDPLRDEGIGYVRLLGDRGHAVEWIHAPDLYHGAFSSSGFLPTAAARADEVWAASRRLLR
ncbi:MAG: alpha/beta hydrolase [Actinomycetota bacterium]|nr:alpha/beta hydrolase [Actinomycetota bacterium]